MAKSLRKKAPIAWPAPLGPHRSNAIGPKRFEFASFCTIIQIATEQGDEATVKKTHDAADDQQCLGHG